MNSTDPKKPTVQPVPTLSSAFTFAELTAPTGEKTATGPKLTVRFLRRWQAYYVGDVATFPARMARSLVSDDVAEAVNWGDPNAPPANPVYGLRYPVPPADRRKEKP